jgi:hypothetical protein
MRGSGRHDQTLRETGLPEPEFKLTDGFVTTLQRKPEGAFDAVGGQAGEKLVPAVAPPATGEVTGQVTGQVDPWVWRALFACEATPLKSIEIQAATGLRHRETFQRNYLDYLLRDELLERTLPDKPISRLQKYRLTDKGRAMLSALRKDKQAT